jgi:hypothetical protein
MPIEFTVRTEDLKRAARQLQVNRDEFKDTDVADLVVSPSTLEMKAVGTETCIAANGKQPGAARLPLKIFAKLIDMAKTYHQRESTILVDDGYAKVGRTKTSHPDITVGDVCSHPLSIPPNASAIDTLAVASMMTPEQIADAGLRDRVENAQKRASAAVVLALGALKEFNVTSTDLAEIIDQRVAEAAEVIRGAVKD